MTKIRKYTEQIMVRLDKRIILDLHDESAKLEMNEAVYCRKAIEHCLKKHCINHK